jgi:hypothetical protein
VAPDDCVARVQVAVDDGWGERPKARELIPEARHILSDAPYQGHSQVDPSVSQRPAMELQGFQQLNRSLLELELIIPATDARGQARGGALV